MNYPEHSMPTSRMIYVKQDFMKEIQQKYQPAVLVNPHFINVQPHFNKKFLTNQTIHINPLFQQKGKQVTVQEVAKISHISNNSGSINSNLLTNQKKKLTNVQDFFKVQTSTNISNNKSTNINSKQSQSCNGANNLTVGACCNLIRTPKKETANNNKRSSIHTKYKIIRTNVAESVQKGELNVITLVYKKNRFKLDNRTNQDIRKSKLPKKKVNYVRYNFKTNFDFNNSLIYKKRLSLTRRKSEHNQTKFKICKEKMLQISGQDYKLDSNHRTLTLMANSSRSKFKRSVRVVEFKKKRANVCSNISFKLGSSKVQSKKLKKSNVPCPLYRKFGRCKGKDRGTCIRIHNPDQINLCPKFLQGACVNDRCLLSHKVSAEKMPTCKYYLNGLCSKDNCPYLHVKINPKADICKDFLEGFCKLAAECEKRHEYVCPDFEKSRKCLKQNCQYPHLGTVSSIIKPILSKMRTKAEKPKHKQKSYAIVNAKANEKSDDGVKESMKRYYEISSNSSDTVPDKIKIEDDDMELSSSDDDDNLTSKERKSIGELPSFIPFQ